MISHVDVTSVALIVLISNKLMKNPSVIPESQHALIDELLARQDEVINQLDDLEQKLLNTIEEIRPSKMQEEASPSIELSAADASIKRAA